MIHMLPCRNPCRLYIHLAFTYSIGPSSILSVKGELVPPPPFPPMRVLLSALNNHGSSVLYMKWPLLLPDTRLVGTRLTSKVECGPILSDSYLNRTPRFDWYVVW